MSFIGGGLGVGAGPGSGLRFASTRGRIQGSPVQGVNYPSPFFDVAHTYLPVTIKQLFRWCRYYFLTNPLINAVVFKMSEYPITDIVIDHKEPEVRKKWNDFYQEHLRYRAFQVESGLDYHCYGNCLISMGFPFKKYLYCQRCEFREEASRIQNNWVFTNHQFRLSCPKCGNIGDAIAKDYYYKNSSGIKLIRWNPEDVEINYNDISGEYTYFYTIPQAVRNDIIIGRKDVVQGVPQVFIQALREQKGVIFSKDNLFHFRRPNLANQDRGWGIPLLLPVLKDTFYLQIMKKAQEAILLEHIVPLRILFPQAAGGTSDPYTTINLTDWRDHVAAEIARWRYDNNYIPIMPLPVGNQTIGGDGKALLLVSEIQAWSEQIINGMQVPLEFIKGGMSYAGTNVSMRMLENQFLGYILRHKALCKFIMKQVAAFTGWPEVNIRFKPFKMADDLQRKAYLFQLNQANKISDTTLLQDADLDQEEENSTMVSETDTRIEATKKQQLAMAEIQGEAQLIMSQYQVRAQQEQQKSMMSGPAPGEPGGPEGQGTGAPGTPGGQEAGPQEASVPPELRVQSPGGGSVEAQPQQPPEGFLPNVSSQLSQGQNMSQNGGMQTDLPTLAMQQAQLLANMNPQLQTIALNNLRAQSPEFADLVEQMLAQLGQVPRSSGGGASDGGMNGAPAVDMRPLPEQRSPRRANPLV
jgi:hypothetical protein